MGSAGPWTALLAAIRLSEAQKALRTARVGRGLNAGMTYWPTVLAAQEEAYGYNPLQVTQERATSAQLTRMDETLTWVSRWLSRDPCEAAGLPRDAGWLVWCRAGGWSYARIGKARREMWNAEHARSRGGPNQAIPGGNSRPSLVAIEERTLAHLASCLNRATVPLDRETEAAVTGGRFGDGKGDL